MTKREIISARSVRKSFSGKEVIPGIEVQVSPGHLYGLLGPNGSGKTTIIKLLTGQLKPDAGTIRVNGVDVVKDPVRARSVVGIMPEQENPPSFLTPKEYLVFIGHVRKIPDIGERANRWFDFLDFASDRDVLCKDLSRGTRQKLLFAQAFIHEPSVVFIDEPLINLDPITQKKVKQYLKKLTRGGTTVFLSTHVLAIAEEICTRVGILYQGTIRFEKNVKNLKQKQGDLESFFIDLMRNQDGA